MVRRVLISGASGLVGQALAAALRARGDTVASLVRRAPSSPLEIPWDPRGGWLDPDHLRGFDAVVHLAGENVGAGRWTAARRAAIASSRIEGTRLLATSLCAANAEPPPFVAASATGFYGDRGEERLDEASAPGAGFLAETCVAWEAQAEPLRARGGRVVHLRTSLVLARKGGALAKMLLPFRLGLGGRIGSGRQWWSWIALEDLVAIYLRSLDEPSWSGPINATAPEPVTNLQFTRALGSALHRPTIFPLPAFAARLMLGREMANELLLASARVEPRFLAQHGFAFRYPELGAALRAVLGVRGSAPA
ncbi:MAG: TIGR01777 family oxidoreductase [Planctomycetes bacterium]|nr:TIGR01777 family oxidoreductase [Planctomycetota bacterium]